MRFFNKALQNNLQEPEKLTVLESELVFGSCGIQPQFGEFNKELPTEAVQNMCQLCATKQTLSDDAHSLDFLQGDIPQEIIQLLGYALPGQMNLAQRKQEFLVHHSVIITTRLVMTNILTSFAVASFGVLIS